MDKDFRLPLLLLLLLCHKGNMESQTFCPPRCQCFTPSQLLCADERMSSLPRNISTQVTEVIVMTTSLTYLLPNSFPESPQLTRLVLLNNALRSIHSRAFESLTELEELEVSGNPWLEHLFLGTFSKQVNLTKLLLNYNRFGTLLPGTFDSLGQLETLQVKSNIIANLPLLLFHNLHNLHILDLSLNNIAVVQRETFSGLDKLEILKLNYNRVQTLKLDTFHSVPELIELSLEGNRLVELPDGVFAGLTKLKVLNLHANLLTTFSDRAFGMEPPALTELNLRGNRLQELSSLSGLSSLTHLILSSNQLSRLPTDIFSNLTILETLDLSENQLDSLPERLFYNLFAIKVLHLHNNNLTKVAAKLFGDQMIIQQLYLSDNQLQNLPTGLFDTFVMQHKLRLHGNPWRCDCHMSYLHNRMQTYSQDVDMLDKVLCKGPEYLRGQTVASVTTEQLVCHTSKGHMAEVGGCTLRAANDTVIVKCQINKCSPLVVKVQIEDESGSVSEQVLKREIPEHLQCSNQTPTSVPPQ